MDSLTKTGPSPIPNIYKKSCRGGAGAPPSACKRKTEDFPPLMGSSPLLGLSPYVKYMVISSQENRKVAAKSPFKIQRELVKILGAEPLGVTRQCSGDRMVELRGKEQECKIEQVKWFLDIPVTVGPHKSLNTSKGVIKHSEFQDCTEDEFVDEFPDVNHARRIRVRKGDVRIPTNTIVLTFDCPKPPSSLRAGYLTVPVRPYVPFPMRCFKYLKFGHGKDKCRRPNALCGRCGKEHADQHQCTAAAHCINCRGDHPAFSKQCPKFVEEQAILRCKAEHGGTFQQARAAVIVDTPRAVSSRTYAQATKSSLKSTKAAQPKASDKVTASVTSKANAQRHTPLSSPKGAVSRTADKPTARKPSKEGAPREPVSRFGNVSDIDIDSTSDYLSDERKSRSRNTRSLERPLPLSQFQPQSPARPLPPPHSPTHHIPSLIPPTTDEDPIPVNSPPPPPAWW